MVQSFTTSCGFNIIFLFSGNRVFGFLEKNVWKISRAITDGRKINSGDKNSVVFRFPRKPNNTIRNCHKNKNKQIQHHPKSESIVICLFFSYRILPRERYCDLKIISLKNATTIIIFLRDENVKNFISDACPFFNFFFTFCFYDVSVVKNLFYITLRHCIIIFLFRPYPGRRRYFIFSLFQTIIFQEPIEISSNILSEK